jgi:intergrase/recombinase
MTKREQLIQELEQAPDDLVQTVLDFLYRVKASRREHSLAKFAGILSNAEAEELQRTIKTECRQVDLNEW